MLAVLEMKAESNIGGFCVSQASPEKKNQIHLAIMMHIKITMHRYDMYIHSLDRPTDRKIDD